MHQANNDLGLNSRYRKALQDEGLCMIVYMNGKRQFDILFVCTICVGVNICSVRFINSLANAEKIAEISCKEHPMRLSVDDILTSSSLPLEFGSLLLLLLSID